MKIKLGTIGLTTILTLATAMAPTIATAAELHGLFHFHPHSSDTRINVPLYNETFVNQEVRIGGKTYSIQPHRTLIVTVPAGTQIYAASQMHSYNSGSLLLEVTPANESHKVVLD